MKKAHTTENGEESDLGLVFTDARAVADRLTWFLHLMLCHRSGEPFPLSSGSQHRLWVHWGLPKNTTYCYWQVTPDEVFADSRRTGEHTLACLNDLSPRACSHITALPVAQCDQNATRDGRRLHFASCWGPCLEVCTAADT